MYEVGDKILIKRTSGDWEEANVIEVIPDFGIRVSFTLKGTYQGGIYYGGPDTVGYKLIKQHRFSDYTKKIEGIDLDE